MDKRVLFLYIYFLKSHVILYKLKKQNKTGSELILLCSTVAGRKDYVCVFFIDNDLFFNIVFYPFSY